MGTPFEDVIDLALVTIRDYKLDNVYSVDREAFNQIMYNYLLRGLPKFVECITSLKYDDATHKFTEDLSLLEQSILADWTVIQWYTSELQDVLEFKEPLTDSDFKKYSTGQNLKPRHDYLDALREKVKQDITEYELQNLRHMPFFGQQG